MKACFEMFEGFMHQANMFELNIWLKRLFLYVFKQYSVSHLLRCLSLIRWSTETETCPQTGDGGEFVEGLPPGCLIKELQNNDTNKSSLKFELKAKTIGVLSLKFANVKIVFSQNSTCPPRIYKNLTMSSGRFEVLLLQKWQ